LQSLYRKGKKAAKGFLAAGLSLALVFSAQAAFQSGRGNGSSDRFLSTQSTSSAQAETNQTKAAETTAKADTSTAETKAVSAQTAGTSSGMKTVSPSPTTSKDTGTGALTWTENGVTYYRFEGKKYVVKEDWGVHYLTGFSPESTGSTKTRSGAYATSNYTAASTLANLGKVILVKAEGGSSTASNISRYDGVYKCEDTGGAAVEYGLSTTGSVPVVDLFFDTAHEADMVSEHGWIFARIYILQEVK